MRLRLCNPWLTWVPIPVATDGKIASLHLLYSVYSGGSNATHARRQDCLTTITILNILTMTKRPSARFLKCSIFKRLPFRLFDHAVSLFCPHHSAGLNRISFQAREIYGAKIVTPLKTLIIVLMDFSYEKLKMIPVLVKGKHSH